MGFISIFCTQGLNAAGQNKDLAIKKKIFFEPNVLFDIEIVSTPKERSQGLMYRKELAPKSGMFFIFDETKDHPFWMKNTYIPLDIIFLDDNYVIVGIAENAKPLSLNYVRADKPSRYVLELNAGKAKAYGLKEGMKAKILSDQKN